MLAAKDEPWGLVVNEVMCAALPVVVSSELGCAVDLVKDGVNGYVVPAGDATALAGALQWLLADEPLRKRMGAASRSMIARWSYEECRSGVTSALQCVIRRQALAP